jgi:rubrerythrin
MAVLDEALKLEQRAKKYYTEAQDRLSDPSAKKILGLLAAEEGKHEKALEAMQKNAEEPLGSSDLLVKARGLVEGAMKDGQAKISSDASMREVLQKAMEIEQATRRFYLEQSTAVTAPGLRELFVRLAAQEETHYFLVSSLAEYFDRPQEWVESAEFGMRPEPY